MNTEITEKTENRVQSKIEVQAVEPKLKEPAMFKVTMHNDDFTPMEFVVAVLELFFGMERAKAISVMFEVHSVGQAVCGTYSKDVADTKVEQVTEYARRHDHPLLCSIEAVR